MPAADENVGPAQGLVTSPPPGVPSGGMKPAEKQYEFRPNENKIIGQLASKMHFVGLYLLAMGLIVITIGVIVLHGGPIISGALTCVVGLWTQRASVSFRHVVRTEGRDISHLMDALDDLRKLYSFQYWLFILGLVLSVAGLGAAWMGYVNLVG